ncbi:MAG: hypothetical protein WCG06_04565, partial [Candidatus Omnitrophota bacterium]
MIARRAVGNLYDTVNRAAGIGPQGSAYLFWLMCLGSIETLRREPYFRGPVTSLYAFAHAFVFGSFRVFYALSIAASAALGVVIKPLGRYARTQMALFKTHYLGAVDQSALSADYDIHLPVDFEGFDERGEFLSQIARDLPPAAGKALERGGLKSEGARMADHQEPAGARISTAEAPEVLARQAIAAQHRRFSEEEIDSRRRDDGDRFAPGSVDLDDGTVQILSQPDYYCVGIKRDQRILVVGDNGTIVTDSSYQVSTGGSMLCGCTFVIIKAFENGRPLKGCGAAHLSYNSLIDALKKYLAATDPSSPKPGSIQSPAEDPKYPIQKVVSGLKALYGSRKNITYKAMVIGRDATVVQKALQKIWGIDSPDDCVYKQPRDITYVSCLFDGVNACALELIKQLQTYIGLNQYEVVDTPVLGWSDPKGARAAENAAAASGGKKLVVAGAWLATMYLGLFPLGWALHAFTGMSPPEYQEYLKAEYGMWSVFLYSAPICLYFGFDRVIGLYLTSRQVSRADSAKVLLATSVWRLGVGALTDVILSSIASGIPGSTAWEGLARTLVSAVPGFILTYTYDLCEGMGMNRIWAKRRGAPLTWSGTFREINPRVRRQIIARLPVSLELHDVANNAFAGPDRVTALFGLGPLFIGVYRSYMTHQSDAQIPVKGVVFFGVLAALVGGVLVSPLSAALTLGITGASAWSTRRDNLRRFQNAGVGARLADYLYDPPTYGESQLATLLAY